MKSVSWGHRCQADCTCGAHYWNAPGGRGVALALDNAVASTLDFSEGFTANRTVRLRGARSRTT
ncbi:hypothetical protein ABZ864_47150 [Streptomyces sp. NPDC047082]|uniref:hypothetical protein n=1 Tax=Streptomyces sp. NPDC047082 TaxID=3155259 RepID=UPI0033EA3758